MSTDEHTPCLQLGSSVTVVIDRPIGYRHGDLVYPVNYGYIPGVFAADGEEQDAYILGVSEPLTTFTGTVIGIIHRLDDVEDKLVVAPEGTYFHHAEIMEAVHFQEQFFASSVEALFHRSCGVIPFRQRENGWEILTLQQISGTWTFPKGHMELEETEQETALRELREEAGLTAKLIPGFSAEVEYDLSEGAWKKVILFPGTVCADPVCDPGEILSYRWVSEQELAHYLRSDMYASCAQLIHHLISDIL